MEAFKLDEIDHRLIHALTVEPRAPFRSLGAAVGVSDQTAARRYHRLREQAGLRVVGRVNGARLGWADWYVRIQCVPGAATAIATALAGRADTSWVALAAGGTEVLCALQARTEQQRDALLLAGLPESRRVVHLTAHSLLHEFTAPFWGRLPGRLTEAERSRLDPVPVSPAGPAEFTADDELLAGHLAYDGRATNASLAAALGWHESTVRRRILELRRSALLSFDLDIDPAPFGIRTHTMLWASVDPAQLDAVGRAIASHPEIPFAAATTGPRNLIATVVAPDTSATYSYFTGPFAALPGIRGVDTSLMMRIVKRAGPVRGNQPGAPRPSRPGPVR